MLITYAALWGLARRIPYAQEPGYLVTATKRNAARRPGLFQGAKLRRAIFGDSRILSGFIPATFDSALHRAGYASVESYNYGLPGESAFLADMDGMIADGNAPNLILLTDAWPRMSKPELAYAALFVAVLGWVEWAIGAQTGAVKRAWSKSRPLRWLGDYACVFGIVFFCAFGRTAFIYFQF